MLSGQELVQIDGLKVLFVRANFLLVVVRRESSVLVRGLDALDATAERLKQVALEVLAQHVDLVVAKVLPVRRLLAAVGEQFVDRRQVSLVVVHAARILRLRWLFAAIVLILRQLGCALEL